MSIQHQIGDCYLLSHEAKLNDIYLAAVDEGHHSIAAYTYDNPHPTGHLKTFEVNAQLFAINSAYVRDQQTTSPTMLAAAVDDEATATKGSRKRRRQKKAAPPPADVDAGIKEMQAVIDTIALKSRQFQKLANAKSAALSTPNAIHHDGDDDDNNAAAIALAQSIQDDGPAPYTFRGENSLYHAVLSTIGAVTYLIPPRCEFYQDDVRNIEQLLDARRADDDGGTFDLVVIDPPWWNRYVRRAKRAKPAAGYQMLDDQAIGDIPLERYVRAGSLVAIWCTNAPAHMAHVRDALLPKWNLKLLSTWYWVKVTRDGTPVCPFRDALQKQPFERLFVACHAESDVRPLEGLRETRYLFSVPSAVHSHKPPVIDLFQHLLPATPKCLEIFARYLLPHFTSIGFEVLKMQNRKLFVNVEEEEDDDVETKQLEMKNNNADAPPA